MVVQLLVAALKFSDKRTDGRVRLVTLENKLMLAPVQIVLDEALAVTIGLSNTTTATLKVTGLVHPLALTYIRKSQQLDLCLY